MMLRMNREFMLHMKEKYELDDDGEVVLRKVTVTKGAAVLSCSWHCPIPCALPLPRACVCAGGVFLLFWFCMHAFV